MLELIPPPPSANQGVRALTGVIFIVLTSFSSCYLLSENTCSGRLIMME